LLRCVDNRGVLGELMRRWIFEALSSPSPRNSAARVVSICLLVLIATNVAASIIETDAEVAAAAPDFFRWFENVSVAVFTLEYLLRLWSATADERFAGPVRGRFRLAMTPMMLIDFAAVAPSYAAVLVPGIVDLRFLRVLRLLRMFRLLRAPRVAGAFSTMTRVLRTKRVELGVTLAILMAAVLLSAGAIYAAEHTQEGTQFTSIPRSMWWAIVTITTVGYGDIVPVTAVGRAIAGVVAFVGICAIALPVGILSSAFIQEVTNKNQNPLAGDTCATCGRPFDKH
jgi:voltage-gated potassium channel